MATDFETSRQQDGPSTRGSRATAGIAHEKARTDALKQISVINDWRLDRLVRYLEENLRWPLSLAKAAELCALETTYFSRYFQSRTGVNFTDWYRRLRVERAKTLLADQYAKVDTVFEAVGYKNITTFERAFRRCTGLCPGEYKRAVRSARRTQSQDSTRESQGTTGNPQETPTLRNDSQLA